VIGRGRTNKDRTATGVDRNLRVARTDRLAQKRLER
jgi:hypothetical protein